MSPLGVFIYVLTLSVVLPNPATAQQKTVSLTAADIMRMVIDNMEKNELLKSKFISFERKHVEYELDRNGKQKSILKNVTSYHGEDYPKESRASGGGFSINLSAVLSLSYDYTFLDPNSSDYLNLQPKYQFACNNCYIMKFEPKKDNPGILKIAPPDSSRIESGIYETAMRMEGTIFIDKVNLSVRKYAGELGLGFDKGSLSSVRVVTASLDLEQEPRPDLNNITVFKTAEISYQIRVAWLKYITRKEVWEWNNYRLNK